MRIPLLPDAQVLELFAAEMGLDQGAYVEELLRRWARSLEVVELDAPSFGTLRTLAQLDMPRLRQIIVEDKEDDVYEDRDLGISQSKLLRKKT